MPSRSFILLASALSLVSVVSAHGNVISVSGGGKTIQANSPYAGKLKDSAVRQMPPNDEANAFVTPDGWGNNNEMACRHTGVNGAALHLEVQAGSTVRVQWEGASPDIKNKPGVGHVEGDGSPWAHATGPTLSYLTSCNGDCADFNPTNAGWTKIQHAGIDMGRSISSQLRQTMKDKNGVGEPYYPTGSGVWASADLVARGSYEDVKIPSQLKAGSYLLRHEISSMHSPKKNQNYISCIQLKVTGSGTASLPFGTQAKDLYPRNGQFATFDIYSDDAAAFKTPGPALWNPTGSDNTDPVPAPEPKPSSSKPEPPVSTPGTPASTPGTPTKSDTPKPSSPVKCRPRKRSLPAPVAASKRHHRRLSSDH